MSERTVVFNISQLQTNELLPQISQALERRTELISREKYPGLWKQVDKNVVKANGNLQNRRPNKGMSVVCLLLGVFLLVPGLKEPGELFVPLIAGGGAIIAGLIGLLRGGKEENPSKQFDQAAQKLLFARGEIKPGQFEVSFTDGGMVVADLENGTSETVPAALWDSLVETADTFLLTYDQKAMVLKKADITVGNEEIFRELMKNQVKRIHLL